MKIGISVSTLILNYTDVMEDIRIHVIRSQSNRETHRIGRGVIGIHFGSELLVQLGAAVARAGSEMVGNDGEAVVGEWAGAHVEEHAGDVEERGEEEEALAADEDGEEVPGDALD